MTVRINKHEIDKTDFAFVCAHEMAHLRGMRHPQMLGRPAYDSRRLRPKYDELYSWAEEYTIETDAQKKKSVTNPDVQVVRYSRVMKNLANWQTKLKRATNAIAKFKQQARRYERALTQKGLLEEAQMTVAARPKRRVKRGTK